MALFVGLDVSLRMTSIWEGKALSEPTAIVGALTKWRKKIQLVGVEACPLSEWLHGAINECGLHTVCIEVRHAHRFLSSRPNKTDRNDARGIADMMRMGHYRPVHVKSKQSLMLRTTLIARKKFIDQMIAIEQTIRGLLKVYGLKVGAVHRCTFSAKVEQLLADSQGLSMAIEPLLEARNMMRRQKVVLDRRLHQLARKSEACKRLMTIPGIGPIISLANTATIDDPARFKSSKAVAAHIGLTPRVYQSARWIVQAISASAGTDYCVTRFMKPPILISGSPRSGRLSKSGV
jgi:transposase